MIILLGAYEQQNHNVLHKFAVGNIESWRECGISWICLFGPGSASVKTSVYGECGQVGFWFHPIFMPNCHESFSTPCQGSRLSTNDWRFYLNTYNPMDPSTSKEDTLAPKNYPKFALWIETLYTYIRIYIYDINIDHIYIYIYMHTHLYVYIYICP